MRCKDETVNVRDLTVQMQEALLKIESVYLDSVEMVVTSGKDGIHMRQSKHYEGNAVDLRTKHLTWAVKSEWRDALKRTLGPDYDVILEGMGTDKEHLHVELDPKPDPTVVA